MQSNRRSVVRIERVSALFMWFGSRWSLALGNEVVAWGISTDE